MGDLKAKHWFATAAVVAVCAGATIAGVAGAGAQGTGGYTTSTGTQQAPRGALRFCLRFDRAGKKVDGAINFGVHCHRGVCIVAAGGKIVVRTGERGGRKVVVASRSFKLGRDGKTVGGGKVKRYKLKLSGNATRQIRSALEDGGVARARIVAKGSNGAGKSRTRRKTVKLHL